MSGTGYAAVGHLLELGGKEQNQSEFKHVFVQLAIQMHVWNVHCMGLQTSMDVQGQFKKFFHNVSINVDSTYGYLSTIIKRSEEDDFTFGLDVERAVWDLLKSDEKWTKALKTFQKFAEERGRRKISRKEEKEGICF